MIYTMPRNQAIIDLVPKQPTSDQIQGFLDRIAEGLVSRGYVLGPMKVFIGPGPGEIMVDADRDPRDEWLAFVPPTQSVKEKSTSDRIAQLRDVVLPALNAGTANPVAAQKALGWLVERELARMNGGGA